jgi:hydrogenase expression/formation protein HypC
MCLGIPGRITEVWHSEGAPMAHADFDGRVRRVCLAYLPDLTIGDYVITHMGYALTRIDEADAAATLAMMREYGVLDAAPPTEPAVPGDLASPQSLRSPA